jgi:hypothetical protein
MFDKWLTGKMELLNYPLVIAFFAPGVNGPATNGYVKQSIRVAIRTGSGTGTFLGMAKTHPELSK